MLTSSEDQPTCVASMNSSQISENAKIKSLKPKESRINLPKSDKDLPLKKDSILTNAKSMSGNYCTSISWAMRSILDTRKLPPSSTPANMMRSIQVMWPQDSSFQKATNKSGNPSTIQSNLISDRENKKHNHWLCLSWPPSCHLLSPTSQTPFWISLSIAELLP